MLFNRFKGAILTTMLATRNFSSKYCFKPSLIPISTDSVNKMIEDILRGGKTDTYALNSIALLILIFTALPTIGPSFTEREINVSLRCLFISFFFFSSFGTYK